MFQVQTLIEDVQRLQSTLAQLRESSSRQLARFEEELQVRSRHIQRLENQLENQKDYQDIRRELRYAFLVVMHTFFPAKPVSRFPNVMWFLFVGPDIQSQLIDCNNSIREK